MWLNPLVFAFFYNELLLLDQDNQLLQTDLHYPNDHGSLSLLNLRNEFLLDYQHFYQTDDHYLDDDDEDELLLPTLRNELLLLQNLQPLRSSSLLANTGRRLRTRYDHYDEIIGINYNQYHKRDLVAQGIAAARSGLSTLAKVPGAVANSVKTNVQNIPGAVAHLTHNQAKGTVANLAMNAAGDVIAQTGAHLGVPARAAMRVGYTCATALLCTNDGIQKQDAAKAAAKANQLEKGQTRLDQHGFTSSKKPAAAAAPAKAKAPPAQEHHNVDLEKGPAKDKFIPASQNKHPVAPQPVAKPAPVPPPPKAKTSTPQPPPKAASSSHDAKAPAKAAAPAPAPAKAPAKAPAANTPAKKPSNSHPMPGSWVD